MTGTAGQGRRAFGAVLAIVLALAVAPAAADGDIFVTSPAQPGNVGDAILAAVAYHDSGAYDRDVAMVAGRAAAWVKERAAQGVTRPAMVFDIDETALSNWEVIKRDDFGRPVPGPCDRALDGPCGWAAWDQLGVDPAIGPTLDVFKAATTAKVAVFFITGRPEDQRAATERNLREAGYDAFVKLHMVPPGAKFGSAADYKTPIRAAIEKEGYTIVANIGDQPSDLLGGFAERIFLLPNPFYRVP